MLLFALIPGKKIGIFNGSQPPININVFNRRFYPKQLTQAIHFCVSNLTILSLNGSYGLRPSVRRNKITKMNIFISYRLNINQKNYNNTSRAATTIR